MSVFIIMLSVPLSFAILLKANTFAYIGQPMSTNPSWLMLGGYRHYNSATGRFVKQDSDLPFQGARLLNGYDHSAGNPIAFKDATGHAPEKDRTYCPLVDTVINELGNDIPIKDLPDEEDIITQEKFKIGDRVIYHVDPMGNKWHLMKDSEQIRGMLEKNNACPVCRKRVPVYSVSTVVEGAAVIQFNKEL